ncbi:uncharacterized protein LOC110629206 [Manihot esculenta]|uniref:uncharacterized protein LOC110629206 n=1 Tax=Manihot esculenta TaxID=3983 RepID=UPI000B5D567A|nr:uncharacterized protein LOC110629206 [Manihot esculenta]
MTTNNNQTFLLRSVLEKDKLNGTNFIDWYRNLRIVLKQEKNLDVLDHPLPIELARNATAAQREAFKKKKVTPTMTSTSSFAIMVHLKEMFQEQARQRFVTTKALTSCKMALGTPVSSHVLKMKWYLDTLEKLNVRVNRELAIDLILGSLLDSYDSYIMNYNMHKMDKSVTELHGMLKSAEENIHKTNHVLIVQKGISKKGKAKGKVPTKSKDNKAGPKSKDKRKRHPSLSPSPSKMRAHASTIIMLGIGKGTVLYT